VGDVPFPDQISDEESLVLSRSYETVFERTLQEVALAATAHTVLVWPSRVRSSRPSASFQTRTV
jgi:hypothetical protein